MSGWRGPNDPAPGADAEARFRKNVRETLMGWLRRLERPDAASAIGAEAEALRAVAHAHGWSAVATHLDGIGQVSRTAPGLLAPAISAFERFLGTTPSAAPPAADRTVVIARPPGVELPAALPGSIPMPPMLDDSRPPKTTPVRPSMAHGETLASARGPEPNLPSSPAIVERPDPVRLPDSVSKPPPQPKLLVKTVLGFRAFGKREKRSSAPPGPLEPGRESPLLGLERRSSKPPDRRSTPPWPGDLGSRRNSSSPGPLRPSFLSDPRDGGLQRRPSHSPSGRPAPRAEGRASPRWPYILAAAIAFLAASTVIVVLVGTQTPSTKKPVVETPYLQSARGAALVSSAGESEPAPKVGDPMVDAVHQQGQETAELRALIDQQSRMLANCRVDATQCDKWARVALLLAPVEAGTFVASSDDGRPLPAWLQRLKIPREFPARDDPALAAFYGYDAKHPTGRAAFQLKLFRCSKYEDIFDTTLVKYGAPGWLKSVVYQESGCDPVITSPAGARGLWQFMPESARAYGLLVNEKGDVDERLNPAKATDAAIHFLMDLHTKLGAWDLALAGYNMGPYAVALRIAEVGGRAGFWDLRRNDLLPAETADYVPAIEAFALILENRRSLGFPIDVPLPESTSELNVRPGTRLSLIARVARTSTTRVKEYNLDFLGQIVPMGETTARIPISSDQVLQVQEALDNWPPDDTRDMCAPQDYVWGSGDFDTTPYGKKCHSAAGP